MSDHRSRPRRRGERLNTAIFQATLDELAEVGYARLTMEGVADRAGVGKASLYRRWTGRMELVFDAVQSVSPDPADPPDTGSLRGDLLAWLRSVTRLLAGPAGEALRGLVGDALADADRTQHLRTSSHGIGRRAMTEISRRAVERGEIRPGSVTPVRLDVAQAMVRHHFLFRERVIPDEVVVQVVDEVVIPLLRSPAADIDDPASAGP
ncbi:TetR/AcrR family transcriptional regulator [Amycolatopsis sp. OK19-0408]|uniref:TetR/AcrR family transcriptional regulator n=1 Tax=Amycolatopsis iheyensis TaxID=2945988 RepID=A0A9X2NMA5_9PSEU|nr:TetR/AcrR family transcriptional regulator [Amycolatopsis iheyensis]MCR6490663.1 TetR/AcrR family transcriptional regulator [Amycolatopsis iheyensis]